MAEAGGRTRADELFDSQVRALQQGEDQTQWRQLWFECFTAFVEQKRQPEQKLGVTGFFYPSRGATLSLVHHELQGFFGLIPGALPAGEIGHEDARLVFDDLYGLLEGLMRFCAGVKHQAAAPKFKAARGPAHSAAQEDLDPRPQLPPIAATAESKVKSPINDSNTKRAMFIQLTGIKIDADDPLLADFKPQRVGGGWALSFKERKKFKALKKARQKGRKAARLQRRHLAATRIQGRWRSLLAVHEANRRWRVQEEQQQRASCTELVDKQTRRPIVLPVATLFGGVRYIEKVVASQLATASPTGLGALGAAGAGAGGSGGGWRALRRLELRGCTGLSDSLVEVISTSLPQLTELDLSGAKACTDASLAHIARAMAGLHTLQLCAWERITPEGFARFAGLLARNRTLSRTHTPKRLAPVTETAEGSISSSGGGGRGVGVGVGVGVGMVEASMGGGEEGQAGSDGPVHATHALQRLAAGRSLSLRKRAPAVVPIARVGEENAEEKEKGKEEKGEEEEKEEGRGNDKGVDAANAAIHICVPSLRRLNLSACSALDDKALEAVGGQLQGVVDLCLYGCKRLTDRAAIGLVNKESRLRHLNTAGSYKMTDGFHRYLLNQQPRMVFYNNPNQFGQHACAHTCCAEARQEEKERGQAQQQQQQLEDQEPGSESDLTVGADSEEPLASALAAAAMTATRRCIEAKAAAAAATAAPALPSQKEKQQPQQLRYIPS